MTLRQASCCLPCVPVLVRLVPCRAGEFAEGSALAEEGLRIAETIGAPRGASWLPMGLGSAVPSARAISSGASPVLERAMSLCQADLPGLVLQDQLRPWAAAYPLWTHRRGHATAHAGDGTGDTATESIYQARCRLCLGEAYLLAGRLEEAQALAERALALARAHQERGHQAYALRLLGEIAARREPPESEQAEAHYHQALALAEELGMRPLLAHCHRGLGTLYAKTGQREQARTALSTAIEMYRAMEMTFWLPQTEAALAQVEGR